MLTDFKVISLCPEVDVLANPEALLIAYSGDDNRINLSKKSSWSGLRKLNEIGHYFGKIVETLIEQELVESHDNNLRINYKALFKLAELDCDFLEGVIPPVPFSIEIRSSGHLGSSAFKLMYEYKLSQTHAFLERVGPFLKRRGVVYRLSQSNFELIEAIDNFNALPAAEKTKEGNSLVLARVKELTGGVGLDPYLQRESVLVPHKVKVDVIPEENGLISLFPRLDGLEPDTFGKVFWSLSDIQHCYDLQEGPIGRTRVIISKDLKPVLQDIQKIRKVGGATRDQILANPMSCFSDGVNRDCIEIMDFAPRVKGICPVPKRAQLKVNTESRDWAGIQEEGQVGDEQNKPIVLNIPSADISQTLQLSFREFREFAKKISHAQAKDQGHVKWGEDLIFIDEKIIQQVQEMESLLHKKGAGKVDIRKEAVNWQVLDIYQNLDSTTYFEGTLNKLTELWVTPVIPKSLRTSFENRNGAIESFSLKRHQIQGVVWLQNLFNNRTQRRGGLLADDMGLGKTLQILTFLAWCIESGYQKGLGAENGPYEPVLIVAPMILLENWQNEMNKYFAGDIFTPSLILHGENLKKMSLSSERPTRETKDGRQRLDIDQLKKHRVVITNYDTVKNYQHSLGKVPWSIIVTDEAHEIKDSNQKSDSLKALKAQFRIVATGTPVENRLLDLWNLIDFMHPGNLLGSAKEFFNHFEKDVERKTPEERGALRESLRKLLFYGEADAFVLRREKESELADLPQKIEHVISCSMEVSLKDLHKDIVRQAENGHHFQLIHALKKLYLHPRLLSGQSAVSDLRQLIRESSKLQKLIELLETIKFKKEKVLIFTQSIGLQNMLAEVLGDYFGLAIEIINGSPDSGRTKMNNKRQEIIRTFEDKDGFNIIILSTRVAGVGLTITGANHVIHYERWWNPAKEAQATDRAYRIGQKKDVHVYYLISEDPDGQIISFDRKLNDLLESKKELAKDFLTPRASVEISEREILEELDVKEGGKVELNSTHTLALVTTLRDVERLGPHQFAALIGLIYKRAGYHSILCPKTNDRGADVLAIGSSEIIYIQCKHSSCMIPQNSGAIQDLEDAVDFYRREVLSDKLKARAPKMTAWTNSHFDSVAKTIADRCGVELNQGRDLESRLKMGISLGELIDFETNRKRSLNEVAAELAGIV
jgi:SNF2 family DNA or RNA helicase